MDASRQVHRGESSLHPRIARKLMQELASRTQATLYALREGLVSLDESSEAARKP